jgi:hypothetical protein
VVVLFAYFAGTGEVSVPPGERLNSVAFDVLGIESVGCGGNGCGPPCTGLLLVVVGWLVGRGEMVR